MKKCDFVKCIMELGNDVTFVYNNKKCGICSEVKSSIFSFQAWCGKEIKEYKQSNLQTVMEDKFFDGKSINELLNIVEFWFV